MRAQLIILCIFVLNGYSYTQSDTLIQSIIAHSQNVEEQGDVKYAVELLKSNTRSYPDSPELRKELSLLYYRSEMYKRSLKQCRKLLRKFEPDAEIYQLKAHCYINIGKLKKAEKSLEEGLKELPQEGVLFTEKGRLAMHQKNYQNAIEWFENGIQIDPNSSGNYYWAAKIYLQSTEELWGLFYGEIFMNLERFSSRTREISSLLFETLNREIVFYNDTAISVNLCMDSNFEIPSDDTTNYVSYGQEIIEPLYKSSLNDISHLSITNIDKFRDEFLKNYSQLNQKEYPNHFLIDFHKELLKKGHFEAYNYWIFMMGNPKEFQAWETENSSQWKLFIRWFEDYTFEIDPSDHYYSAQFK
jgi:tetratricopeptide (TPR) repeat protein